MTTPIKILMVEDCEVDAALLVSELEKAHFHLEWKRVETEMEYRANLAPDLDVIFSDFSVPGISTRRALEVLQGTNLDIPFIIVSGMIGEEQAVESLKAGATDYVAKDRMDRLGHAVRRALREATERKERKQAEEALRESEHRFRQVTESIDELFWLTDTSKNQMIYISPAYEKIWGRTCESLYASPQSWMEAIHPGDRERVRNAALTRQVIGGYDVEYRIVRPDGATHWIHDRAFPIKDASGQVYRVAGVAEDITSRRQLEEQFRQAQKMEAIGQLAAGVAHDFNNLLVVMRGNAELLLMGSSQHDSQTRECLKHIAAAAERAANLTRQLLVFSRKQAMHLQPLSLNDVVSNLARMLKRIIGEQIELKCHYAERLPFVEGDAATLEQALVNLVVNARDAMPRGGQLLIATEKVNLTAACAETNPEARAGEFVCLMVRDTGTGIAPEYLPHIFEPFFTTKEPGKGTGLGLATVYGIAKQHQGWIEISTDMGKGTTFKIFLPAIPRPANCPAQADAETALRGGSETILVVEDEPAVRMIARRTLESFGYTVYEAGSAREALECWSRHAAETALLLSDLVMPGGITGRELARQLRAQKPALKVIFMSGYSAEMASKDTTFFQGPKTNFLQKPCSTRALIRTVRECLDGGLE